MTTVLHVTSSFPRHRDDPVAPFLLDLTRLLARDGLDVVVLAPHDRGAARAEVIDGVRVVRFRYAPAAWELLAYRGGLLGRARTPLGAVLLPAFLVSFAVAVVRAVRTHRPDVVHAHWWLPSGVVAALARRLTGIPFVVTLHGSDGHLLGGRLLRSFGRAVLRRAGAVGVVSRDLQRVVVERTGVEASLLRMPVCVPAPAPLPPAPPLHVLAAGRLSPEKGFDVLVEAAGRCSASGVDLRVTVVGDGPQAPLLRVLAAAHAAPVTFLPAMPRERLWQEMAKAHLVAVPSRREGLGLTALEALALGRRVVGSDVGGLPEVVRDEADGRLVPPDDAAAMADALAAVAAATGALAGRVPDPPSAAAAADHAPAAVLAAHLSAYATARRSVPGTAPS